jgi:hypothetical protein
VRAASILQGSLLGIEHGQVFKSEGQAGLQKFREIET